MYFLRSVAGAHRTQEFFAAAAPEAIKVAFRYGGQQFYRLIGFITGSNETSRR